MQRKFKLVEPKKDISIVKWVTVSSDSQNASTAGSPRINLSSLTSEHSFANSPNYDPNATPKSIKISHNQVFFKNTDVFRSTTRSKRKSKTSQVIQSTTINLDAPNVTPKIIYSPGIVRDTKDWRLDTTRSSKQNLNSSAGVTSRSIISGSDYLDSSRILFKPEIRQNINVTKWVTVGNDSHRDSDSDCRIPPTFSARSIYKEDMSETMFQSQEQSNMNNKVEESRKDIEKLKTELETLINTNLKNKNIIPQQPLDSNLENIAKSVDYTSVVKQIDIGSPPKISKSPLSAKRKSSTSISDTKLNREQSKSPLTKQNIVSPANISKSPSSVRRKSSTLISDTNLNKEEPKSKSRTYDPESTREFIRKQKLRRKEKLQQEELKKKESEVLKKQKLEELKQKTLQLLTENVKKTSSKVCAKPSEEKLSSKSNTKLVNKNKSSQNLAQNKKLRARSFDRGTIKDSKEDIQNNVNENKKKPWRRSRSVSQELKFCDKKSPVKIRKSVNENIPNSRKTDSNPQGELEKVVNEINQMLNNKADNSKDKAATKIQAAFRGYQQRNKILNKSEIIKNIPNKPKNSVPLSTDNFHSEIKITKDNKSNIPPEFIIQNETSEIYKAKSPTESKVVSKSAVLSNIDVSKINGVKQKKYSSAVNEDAIKEIESIKQNLETSISQTKLENKRNETPDWLLPPSTLPYPYNFISAVRKKLEIVTKTHNIVAKDTKLQSPTTKDTSIQTLENKGKANVYVQCSIENSREIKEPSIPEIVPPKPEELKSFSSHKCRKQLVYDSPPKLKSPTNIKDISKDIKPRNSKKGHHSTISKSKVTLTSEASDSDTTKNIPEISEEEQFPKHSSVKSDMDVNLKNISFNRPKSIKANGENFTFDQIKVDKNSSNKSDKLSIKSENSDRLKNITFDRQTNHSSLDNLVKPDYKIDTSQISRHNTFHQTNRSKYPSDIDSILTQYSKMKSSSKSHIQNDSQNSLYSEDFNSSSTNHLSLPKTKSKSSIDQIQQNKDKSFDNQTDMETNRNISKARTPDLSKIKSEILASLARQHSSSLSSIPKQISESFSRDSTDINLESLNKISSGLLINSSENILGSLTEISSKSTENPEIKSRSTTKNNIDSLSKDSSKITEIKTVSSNMKELSKRNLSELNLEVNHTKKISSDNNLERLNKNPSKLNSEDLGIKTRNSVRNTDSQINKIPNTNSDILEIKNKHSLQTSSNESQIKTNLSSNKLHSNKGESIMTSSIPENSVALRTEPKSAQKSNVIISRMNESSERKSGSLKSDTTIENYENSISKSFLKSSTIQNLSKPTVNLKIEKEKFFRETKNNPNQIHLKFQAEVHLLNSFNNSLQQVVAVEKSLLDIRDPPASTVNFSRGCGAPDHMEPLNALEPSVCSQDLNSTHMSDSVASETALSVTAAATERSALSDTSASVVSHRGAIITNNPYAGVSLGMFDQMIRDEDNRLEHLKAILKLRDKALFDRTKGELAWLEIQKKQLRENGQLNDVTIIKKKQRGLIIKLEQERHEMQRLKQAHKQAAKERKNALREQKNIIKQQLSSTDQIPTKIRRLSHLERRQSGPLKVYRVESKTEHVRETTMSRNSSGTDETVSVTTSSVVTQISERVSVAHSDQTDASQALKPYPNSSVAVKEKVKSPDKHSEKVKRALLMKEADLEKRRKEAEELLKWHERLKQEEAQVVELERQAKSIQLDDHEKKRVLTGAQLNKIWKGITGSVEKKFDDQKKYQMSKRSLDKFYQNARKIFKEISEERNSSKRCSEESYTSDFDPSLSPSKINLSSSIMTQINETDLSISPNKMLSDRLRKISESSRIDFISSSKADTNTSEHTTISEKSQLSADKNSIISEILSSDQQNKADSKKQTIKDSSIHFVDNKSSSKSSIISELNIISDHESTVGNTVQSEIKSRKSSIESDIPELQIIPNQSLADNLRNSSTDSDLPELQVISENEQNLEENKLEELIEEKSKNISTNSDLIDFTSDNNINLEEIKPDDSISINLIEDEISRQDSKISESKIKSEHTQNSEQFTPDDIQNNSGIIFEHISDLEMQKSESPVIINEVSIVEKESEYNESPISHDDSKILSVVQSLNNDDVLSNIDSNQVITKSNDNESKLSSDLLQLENKTEHTAEENIYSKTFTPKENTHFSVSIGKIISTESGHIASEISPKTIISEENTSKILDENILIQSDSYLPSDELKSEIHTLSAKNEANKNYFISLQEEIQNDSLTKSNLNYSPFSNSSDLKKSSIIQSDTFVDNNISENKEKSMEIKSEILSAGDECTTNFKTEVDGGSNSLITEHSYQSSDIKNHVTPIQSDIEINHIKYNSINEIDENSSSKIAAEILSQTSEKHDTVLETEKTTVSSEVKSSLEEESEIVQTLVSDKLLNSGSKSQESNINSKSNEELINSENRSKSSETLKDSTLGSDEIESKNVELVLELTGEIEKSPATDKQSELEFKSDITEQQVKKLVLQDDNIKSEASTPHESDPYYQTDFERKSETDITSETDQQTKESSKETNVDSQQELSDFETNQNTESVKSSIIIESEIKSEAKTESSKFGKADNESNSETKDNSEILKSEKESATIIESPKTVSVTTKDNDLSEIPVSPLSESQSKLSKKSVSIELEESLEDNKENSDQSIELQNEDVNVSGVSHIDVRKRVSEILADTSRGDKSPRLQDLYVTTYDVLTNSPESTPETGSPTNEFNKRDKSSFTIETPYRNEAQELLRKQLEIEQEIIKLERQQQQQNIPYMFMREIPNKPPPPYKPPNASVTPVNSVIPVHVDQIKRFVSQSANVLYQAYVSGNLKEASYKSRKDDKISSQKFVFDLCKEIALEVCKPIENTRIPSWKTQKNKFHTLISKRPLNKQGLCSVMNRKVLQLLNFEPVIRKDNLIIRWSRKKRDHVDEILVLESQAEETEWTNYDSDEQTIKDNLTSDIMNVLMLETAQVFCEILRKQKKMSWTNYC